MRTRGLIVVLLVATFTVALGGTYTGQERAPVTTVQPTIAEDDGYFCHWQGSVVFQIGDQSATLSVDGLWRLLLHPAGEGMAGVTLDELVVHVPEFTLGDVATGDVATTDRVIDEFFLTEADVLDFSGMLDTRSGVCTLRGRVLLRGVMPGVDEVQFEASASLLSGELEASGVLLAGGAKAGDAILKAKGSLAAAKRYDLNEILKQNQPTITCCGCEDFIILTGGTKVTKVTSSDVKKVKATKGVLIDNATGAKASIVVHCRCCEADQETKVTLDIEWVDSAGNAKTAKVTVSCKPPTAHNILAIHGAKQLNCTAGNCLLLTFSNATVLKVTVEGGAGCISAEKAKGCCKRSDAVLVRCLCEREGCTATVLVKYRVKGERKDREEKITIAC